MGIDRKNGPGEDGVAVATILAGTAGLAVRLPIGLHSVALVALVTLQVLLTVLAAVVLLDPREITQRPRWVVVHTCGLRA